MIFKQYLVMVCGCVTKRVLDTISYQRFRVSLELKTDYLLLRPTKGPEARFKGHCMGALCCDA